MYLSIQRQTCCPRSRQPSLRQGSTWPLTTERLSDATSALFLSAADQKGVVSDRRSGYEHLFPVEREVERIKTGRREIR